MKSTMHLVKTQTRSGRMTTRYEREVSNSPKCSTPLTKQTTVSPQKTTTVVPFIRKIPSSAQLASIHQKQVIRLSTPLKRRLRTVPFTNYDEDSPNKEPPPVGAASKGTVNVNKVPIYMRQSVVAIKPESARKNVQLTDEKGNLAELAYDFDSDSENTQKKNRKKRKLNTSEDKDFVVKLQKTRKRRVKKVVKLQENTKARYDETIGNILKNVMVKVKAKHPPVAPIINTVSTADTDTTVRIEETKQVNVIENEKITDVEVNCNVNNSINIIEDIEFTPKGITKRTSSGGSSADSTAELTPWRFQDESITRNPHFLQLKRSSALPSMHQDLVLEHSICEALGASLNSSGEEQTTLVPSQKQQPMKQTSICDYFGGTGADLSKESNKENVSSLFDVHEFSPIKRSTEEAKTARILTPRQEQLTLSVEKIPYFDLSGKGTENKERTSLERPFRLPEQHQVYVKARRIQFDKDEVMNDNKQPQEANPKSNIPIANETSSPFDPDKEGGGPLQGPIVGIFEEIEESPCQMPNKIYERRKLKRQKWMMPPLEKTIAAESEKLISRRKRKNMRTKSEEREAEAWAQAFNAMCVEVDKFPLEIE